MFSHVSFPLWRKNQCVYRSHVRGETQRMKNLAPWILICSVTVTGWSQVRSNNLPAAIEQIRPSVVQITLLVSGFTDTDLQRLSRPFEQIAEGTGVIVSEQGYVVTAKHVIDAIKAHKTRDSLGHDVQSGEKRILIGLAMANYGDRGPNGYGTVSLANFESVPASEVADDASHDLALLKLDSNPFEQVLKPGQKLRAAPARLSSDRPEEGSAVGVSGYPLEYAVLVTTSGTIASSWTDIEHVDADAYLVDIHVNHGNSGGPAYRVSDGAVIGICDSFTGAPVEPWEKFGALKYNAGLASIVPAKYIIAMLKKQGVAFKEIAAQTRSPQGAPTKTHVTRQH
jgi:S1-C subfamily serine protease